MKKGRIIFIIVVVLMLSALVAALILQPLKGKNDGKGALADNNNTTENLTVDKENFELIELEEYGGVIKINLITPGLDTYGLKVLLYDAKTKKLLSQTEIGEGMWNSGLTDNGFYVVDQQNKKLTVYNREGKETFRKIFHTEENWSSACGLSRDEKLFFFTTLLSGNAYTVNLGDDNTKLIGTEIFATDFVGVKDNEFYLRNVDGDLLVLNEEECKVSVIDNRIKLYTPELCVGYGEYNFISIFPEDNEALFIPITSVDETIITARGNWFATGISKIDCTVIKSYDLKKGVYFTAEIEDSIRSISYTEHGDLIVVTGASDNLKLQILNAKQNKTKKILLQNADDPPSSSERFKTPKANTAGIDKLIKNVPLIHQFPEFPTGCESVSAVMALKYFGENITVTKFVDEFLPKSREFYYKDGKNYGPDPYVSFIGDPQNAASFGCMAPVIETALKNYFEDDIRVVNSTGKTLVELCSDYIDNDIPVLVWATIGMYETNPVNSWYLSEDKRFTWPGNEHCLLLVGYDESNYYFNDPYSGKCISYTKSLCEERHGELGKQSIVIMPE